MGSLKSVDTQPLHSLLERDTPFEHLNHSIRKCTHETESKQPVLRPHKFRDRIRQSIPDGRHCYFQDMLQKSYPLGIFNANHNLLTKDNNRRVELVFLILVTINAHQHINRFFDSHIYDSRLPVSVNHLKEQLASDRKLSEAEIHILATNFCRAQTKLCPIQFDDQHTPTWPHDTILPIHMKTALGVHSNNIDTKGGTAQMYKIEVLEEFISESLRRKIPKSCWIYKNDGLGTRYSLALKVFNEGFTDVFENERATLATLESNPAGNQGFVRYLGSFKIEAPPPSPRTSASLDFPPRERAEPRCYILFECGDFDLAEYFKRQDPPLLNKEIEKFWNDLRQVIVAVRNLHNFDNDGETNQGYHADIKPDNILVVSNEFKLADMGFARILRGNQALRIEIRGGTRTFGAPEYHFRSNDRSTSPQLLDIWSLGTVFSIVATWIIRGQKGRREYKTLRHIGVQEAIKRQADWPNQRGNLEAADIFHDGHDVLPEIAQWHAYLRRIVRVSDSITIGMLDLVDNYMLKGDPRQRCTADQLLSRYDVVLSANRSIDNQAANDDVPKSLKLAKELTCRDNSDSIPIPRLPQRIQIAIGKDPAQALKETKMGNLRLEQAKSAYCHPGERLDAAPDLAPLEIETMDGMPRRRDTNMTFIDTQHLSPQTDTFNVQQAFLSPRIIDPITPDSTPDTSKRLEETRDGPAPERAFDVWNRMRKTSRRERAKDRDAQLEAAFHYRDIVFYIDNAASMQPFWSEVTFLMHMLLERTNKYDKNGWDMHFTCGARRPILSVKDASILKNILDDKKYIQPEWKSDMAACLNARFESYFKEWQHFNARMMNQYGLPDGSKQQESKRPKNLTIIVLTDGVWLGPDHYSKVEEVIVNFYRKLQGETDRGKINLQTDRICSVEFIQFGCKPRLSDHLVRLDDKLAVDNGIPDMIDVQPSSGDLIKMILGSIDPNYDQLDFPETSGQASLVGSQMSTTQSAPSSASASHKRGHSRGEAFLEIAKSMIPLRSRINPPH